MNIYKDVAYSLIKDVSKNHHSWGSDHALVEKSSQKDVLYEASAFYHMNSKVDSLYQNIENLSITLAIHVATVVLSCETCGVNGHSAIDFQMILTR